LFPQLADACPLKDEIIGDGLDILVVRELTGGIYFGKRGTDENGAFDTLYYSVPEIERITHVAM
ncbi:MAG TPA: 3-isopropylmalate dehydrogenase, partial [Clostridiales bacterium]|nr:3-isopropylmalate dehydrogenase [Clostridiales bacterium]